MRVLITGISGFAGSHLTEFLVNSVPEVEIHGVIHRHDRRIQHLREHLTLHRGDLRNALWVDELVKEVSPDYTMHLAAWADVGGSWQQPWITYELNIQCQLNLLEALCRWNKDCRTLLVTSNEVYGLVQPDDMPISEQTLFRPNNPYGVSKIAQDMMGLQYWNSHKLPIIRARSFNHIGPGQADDFVASAFARQIAEIEAKLRDPIVRVGNLNAQRDFTDVRDIARILDDDYIGEPGAVYNVGSGASRPVFWILNTLLELSSHEISVETDPNRLRPSDVPVSVCDNRRLRNDTGWTPEIDLRDTLSDLLEGWREQIKNET